jgi:hypothetical protein
MILVIGGRSKIGSKLIGESMVASVDDAEACHPNQLILR